MNLLSEFYGGHRYVGFWSSPPKYANQFAVKTEKRINELVSLYNGVYNCGISVCSVIDNIPYLLYLPFDFDSGDLESAWKDASNLYNELASNGYDVVINYSGYRGFHVLISVLPRPYTKPQIRVAHKFFTEGLNLKTSDKQIFGDIRRLIRIPGTMHGGRFEKVDNKWKRVGFGGLCKTVAYSPGELLDLDELIEEDDYEFIDYDKSNSNGKNMPDYLCLKRHINNEEPPQVIRYSYVAMLLNKGYDMDEVIDILRNDHGPGSKYPWVDWDEDYTVKQVMHITYAGCYHPLHCEQLKYQGYCLPECINNMDSWGIKNVGKVKG